jgi:hypothetical protein
MMIFKVKNPRVGSSILPQPLFKSSSLYVGLIYVCSLLLGFLTFPYVLTIFSVRVY